MVAVIVHHQVIPFIMVGPLTQISPSLPGPNIAAVLGSITWKEHFFFTTQRQREDEGIACSSLWPWCSTVWFLKCIDSMKKGVSSFLSYTDMNKMNSLYHAKEHPKISNFLQFESHRSQGCKFYSISTTIRIDAPRSPRSGRLCGPTILSQPGYTPGSKCVEICMEIRSKAWLASLSCFTLITHQEFQIQKY